MSGYEVTLNKPQVLREVGKLRGSPGQQQSLDGMLIDIGQDLLLRDLHEHGVLDLVVFKGGTALRKLYAGNAGRFSVDLDFSVRNLEDDPADVIALLTDAIRGKELGPFTYDVYERRGKPHLLLKAPSLGAIETLESKLDVNPPPWLEPQERNWVPAAIHSLYGGPLPALTCVRLEENIAEKVARLNRTSTARDAYDLVWLKGNYRTAPGIGFDEELVRRLAVLKVWVDANGMSSATAKWPQGHEGPPFRPGHWLRHREVDEFDREDIGLLASPPPKMRDLADDLAAKYGFLADLDADEKRIAAADPKDKDLVMGVLAEVSDSRVGTPNTWM